MTTAWMRPFERKSPGAALASIMPTPKIVDNILTKGTMGWWLALLLLLLTGSASAKVIHIRIERREPFADGARFGQTGAYESIAGRLFFEVDPENAANEWITDLDLAPRNGNGRVDFWADFFLLQPVDPAKGNGCLLYDVHNRGNKLALWTFNQGELTNEPSSLQHAGNGFLFRQGYTLLWTGWNGDVMADGTGRLLAGLPVARQQDGNPVTGRIHAEISVDEEKVFSRSFFWSPWGTSKAYIAVSLNNQDAMLTMRPRRSAAAVTVPREDWAFAELPRSPSREPSAAEPAPNPTSLYVKDGFRPGWLYDLVYTARDPRVCGLGLAGLRDAVSFFRYGNSGNPAMGSLDRACIFGISQSGRLIHHFLYEGLNRDAAGRTVFDGAIIHVAGAGKGLFNHRFAMATVYGTQHRGNLSPADFFPFAPMPQTDPVTGRRGDSLARLRARGAVPKIFFVQTATEYWSRAASLLHTDVEGKEDLTIDPNVRLYFIAGSQHLGGGPTDRGICQYPRNPLNHRAPVLRALLVAMDQWVTNDTWPPASRYPRIDDGTLVDVQTFRQQFPRIPGVSLPDACYQPLRLDPGPRWHTKGIADHVPPEQGAPYRTLVPAVGSDGNEVAGIRLPDVAVPLATYMGWNLRDKAFGAGGLLAGLHGSWLEFPMIADAADPRPSIRERYPSREGYLCRYTDAVLGLCRQGYLLEEDAISMLNKAAGRQFGSE